MEHISTRISRCIGRRSRNHFRCTAVLADGEYSYHARLGRYRRTQVNTITQFDFVRHPIIEACGDPTARVPHHFAGSSTAATRFRIGDGVGVGIGAGVVAGVCEIRIRIRIDRSGLTGIAGESDCCCLICTGRRRDGEGNLIIRFDNRCVRSNGQGAAVRINTDGHHFRFTITRRVIGVIDDVFELI